QRLTGHRPPPCSAPTQLPQHPPRCCFFDSKLAAHLSLRATTYPPRLCQPPCILPTHFLTTLPTPCYLCSHALRRHAPTSTPLFTYRLSGSLRSPPRRQPPRHIARQTLGPYRTSLAMHALRTFAHRTHLPPPRPLRLRLDGRCNGVNHMEHWQHVGNRPAAYVSAAFPTRSPHSLLVLRPILHHLLLLPPTFFLRPYPRPRLFT
ncbi:hypothetical protein C8F04DRAFT_528824, partial [Mycena alexandri]